MTIDTFISTTLRIKSDDGGDIVYAVLTDFEPNAGQIIITCWDSTWSCWFSAMGARTIAQFVSDCGMDYLENKLSAPKSTARDRKFLKRAITVVKTALAAQALAAKEPK